MSDETEVIDVRTADAYGHWDHEDIKRLCEYRDSLKAEIERLREALKFIGEFECSCEARTTCVSCYALEALK